MQFMHEVIRIHLKVHILKSVLKKKISEGYFTLKIRAIRNWRHSLLYDVQKRFPRGQKAYEFRCHFYERVFGS